MDVEFKVRVGWQKHRGVDFRQGQHSFAIPNRVNRLSDPPSLLVNKHRWLFPRKYNGFGVKPTNYPPTVPRLRRDDYTSTPRHALTACTLTNIFYFYPPPTKGVKSVSLLREMLQEGISFHASDMRGLEI